MNVVRHVAVGENCKALIRGGSLDLRTNCRHAIGLYDDPPPLVRAEREEILGLWVITQPAGPRCVSWSA
jgi:hypothetical protein